MHKSIFMFPLIYSRIVITGWFSVSRDLVVLTVYFLRGVTVYQYLFVISCFAASVSAMIPWIYYEVDFLGREEVYTGSNFKIIFVLPVLAGVSLLLIPTSRKRKIFFLTYIFIVLPYLLGLMMPNPVHTKMINPQDYTILPVMYIYGIFLLTSGIFAYRALEKSAIDYSWLFIPLEGDAKVNDDALRNKLSERKKEFEKDEKRSKKKNFKKKSSKFSLYNTLKGVFIKKPHAQLKAADKKRTSKQINDHIQKETGKKNLNIKIVR